MTFRKTASRNVVTVLVFMLCAPSQLSGSELREICQQILDESHKAGIPAPRNVDEAKRLYERRIPVVPRINSDPARQNWFEAYADGNSRWPQTHSILRCFILGQLLSEDRPAVQELFRSHLTQKQLERIGEIMSKAHAAFGVPRPDVRHQDLPGMDRMQTIDDDRLSNFWKGEGMGIVNILESYAKAVGWRPKAPTPEERKEIYRLQFIGDDMLRAFQVEQFWQAPENERATAVFTQVVRAVVVAAGTKEGRDLGTTYRNLFRGNGRPGLQAIYDHVDALLPLVRAALRESAPDVTENELRIAWRAIQGNRYGLGIKF